MRGEVTAGGGWATGEANSQYSQYSHAIAAARRPDVFGAKTPRCRTDPLRQTIRRLGKVRSLQRLPRPKKPDSSAMRTLDAATLHPPNTSGLLSLRRQIRNIRNIRTRKRRPDVFGAKTPRCRTDPLRQTIRRLGKVRSLQGLPRPKKPDSSAMETLDAATLCPPNTSGLPPGVFLPHQFSLVSHTIVSFFLGWTGSSLPEFHCRRISWDSILMIHACRNSKSMNDTYPTGEPQGAVSSSRFALAIPSHWR